MFLGFVTGLLDKISYLDKLKIFTELNCSALEIGLIECQRFGAVADSLSVIDYSRFKYLSLHAPCRRNGEKLFYRDDAQTREMLEKILSLHKKLNFSTIVLHPNRVEDWTVFHEYDLPWAVENMDNRNSFGNNISDLKKIFQENDFKMVLDINHCFTVDTTLKTARAMIDNFSDRIKEVHLSGFAEYHDPLYRTKQIELIKIASQLNVPIIIESICNTAEEYKLEYNYVIENI